MHTTFGTVTLDGNLNDWTASDRLTTTTGSTGSFDIYGKYAGNAYVFAVKSSGTTPIGADTTFLLDTDQNIATGTNNGADFYVNVYSDLKPYLYKGDGSYVKPLDAAYDSTGLTLEFAVSADDLKNVAGVAPTAINFVGDVNDTAFFPSSYASGFQYVINSIPLPPTQTVFGNITIDGNITDWLATDRLDYLPGTSTTGYESYGKFAGDAYIFALKAPTGTSLGTNTTFWLDTDRNSSTGYQIFQPGGTFAGFGGAEYKISIDPDGKAYLYTATGTSTFTRNTNPLSFKFDSASQVLELAVSRSLLNGTPQAINIYESVNAVTTAGSQTVYLPGDFNTSSYTIFANKVLPTRTDLSKRVGIVYSQATADKYFGLDLATNQTAYSQLFMATQSQAMQAGIPFDLLTEADLKDMSKLVNYDSLIFPSFRFVNSADLQAIEDNLTDAVYKYGIGLITAGDFLTNNETGAVLSGDPYKRMKTLLDVTRTVGGAPTALTLTAGDISHPTMQGYTANEVIRSYANAAWSSYTGVYNAAADKVLATVTATGQTYNAVMATQTGGRNVHFATEGFMGDNNLLWQAIDWSVFNGQASVSLHLSRNNSLFLTRVDVDQAMAVADVKPDIGQGIFDKLLPILNTWKSAYNFIGSYYLDIGNQDPALATSENYTNWAISKPYYDQLLAAGNEIGSHSYTHLLDAAGYGTPYEDTNAVVGKTALIGGVMRNIIEYEFNQSRLDLEAKLGIKVTGAAIPGAPEKIATSLDISQYYDYISGGYSGVGAGYPNAFGFLTPGQSSVYLAPNLSFDFTLLEFGIPVWNGTTYVPQKLTVAQAAQEWVNEYTTINRHADNAILMMPWHDYGPTNFFNVGYTESMFSTLLAKAYADGSEFTTLDDANQRIKSFDQSKLSITSTGNSITATIGADTGATAFNAGHFGLEVGANQSIKSVNNWYAYNDTTVFTPKDGGTFTINLKQTGQTVDDVTRITSLPMRSELLNLTGDGKSLNFSFVGDGKVQINLATLGGRQVQVTGADSQKITGNVLELTFSKAIQHNVIVAVTGDIAPTIAIPIANVFAEQGTPGTVIDLSKVFTDIDTNPLAITKRITVNSNAALVNAQIIGNNLFLSYTPELVGTANITIQGTSGKLTVNDTFSVTLNPFNGTINKGTTAANTIVASGNIASGNRSLVLGLAGNDTLKTSATGNDRVFGGAGTDTLTAAAGNSYLDGGAGNDVLRGGSGISTLVGGVGSDTLIGGTGSTTLIGVNPFAATPGRSEIDKLQGGSGPSLFVLGDQYQTYYSSGSILGGLADYALISQFKAGRDRIQLNGKSTDYVVGNSPLLFTPGKAIYRKSTTGGLNELIGIVQGVTTLNLDDISSFMYV